MFKNQFFCGDKQIIREGIYVFTEFLKRNFSLRIGKLVYFLYHYSPMFSEFPELFIERTLWGLNREEVEILSLNQAVCSFSIIG